MSKKHYLSNLLIVVFKTCKGRQGRLTERQFEFLPKSSAMFALLTASLDWHNDIEARRDLVVTLFDLAKAFDKR